MDLTNIISAVITMIVAVITTFVIPYIKKKTSVEQLAEVMVWVRIGVQAAEMLYKESGAGAKKKDYVTKFLEEKGYSFDEETINALIESAVLELKEGI